MTYLIDGELVDTYGGDFTYRYVWYYFENGGYTFYEQLIGAKRTPVELVTEIDEIKEYMKMING